MQKPENWGALRPRYEQPRPRKLLALDGGGIRGVMSLQILGKLESLLATASGHGSSFRLCDYFDYIAGTSTGAIIAAGLARGMSVADLVQFYRDAGEQMFEKSHLLDRYKNLYKSDPLMVKLQEAFGSYTTLEPDYLRTLLLVVTRNVTTDSPWPISSNPDARYNDPNRADCNLRIPLWQLVRASTAAPVYFPPEVLNWDPSDPLKKFVFVDGGITPYNNPAFLLYRMATHPAYRLEFPAGERNLLLVSVGTGAAAKLGALPGDADENLVKAVAGLPGALMYAIQVEQDVACRTVGRCTFGAKIDRELGDMIPSGTPVSQDLGRAFLYARYNVELSDGALSDLGCGDLNAGDLSPLDNATPENIEALIRVGQAAGEQVKLEHLGPFVS